MFKEPFITIITTIIILATVIMLTFVAYKAINEKIYGEISAKKYKELSLIIDDIKMHHIDCIHKFNTTYADVYVDEKISNTEYRNLLQKYDDCKNFKERERIKMQINIKTTKPE